MVPNFNVISIVSLLALSFLGAKPAHSAPTLADCEAHIRNKVASLVQRKIPGTPIIRIQGELKEVLLEPALEQNHAHKLVYFATAIGDKKNLRYLVVAKLHAPNVVFSPGCTVEYLTDLDSDETYITRNLNKALGLD